MTDLPEKIYTEQDLTRARTKGKVVGWLQGGGVVLGGAILLNLLGSIPVVVGIAAVAWVLYKLLGGKGDEEES